MQIPKDDPELDRGRDISKFRKDRYRNIIFLANNQYYITNIVALDCLLNPIIHEPPEASRNKALDR